VFPVFVIDDAHLMEKESLMDICSLMFNPLKGTVGASFVLVGDETFEKKTFFANHVICQNPAYRAVNLNALNDDESLEFIRFRVSNAMAPETPVRPGCFKHHVLPLQGKQTSNHEYGDSASGRSIL